ncbi:MAG TPA: flagellar export chaperone FlgN, partial [Feifaniaceae bacterium]|nr:flagellar export chaperone FlgN [Feifaniaceae bacterium]
MRDLIKELEYYMAGELEIYVGLLQYAKSKKTALIKNDLDGIEMLVKLEDEAINRLHTASAQREDLFDRIAKEDGYEGKITYEY